MSDGIGIGDRALVGDARIGVVTSVTDGTARVYFSEHHRAIVPIEMLEPAPADPFA